MTKDKLTPLGGDEPPVLAVQGVVHNAAEWSPELKKVATENSAAVDEMMADKERVTAIRKAAADSKAEVSPDMVKFLIYRGYSAADGVGAIKAFSTDGHWAAADGTYWGSPKAKG